MPRPVLGYYDGAVVSGFFFGTRTVQWVSAIADVPNVLKTLLHVSSPSSSPTTYNRTPDVTKG